MAQKRVIEGPTSNLTPGESRLLDLLSGKLPLEWEIYVQPHLNGRRPDFVLLNPNVGIAVLEVKDWVNFERLDRERHDSGPHRETAVAPFMADARDPATQVLAYKKDIYEIYCPRLAQRSGMAAINAGLIFPYADEQIVVDKFSHRFRSSYDFAVGKQTIEQGDVRKIVPASGYSSSKIMTPDHAADLRSWLIEPDHERSKREPLRLDARQRDYAATRTDSGYRRIRGPAGSGKSLVVASRAAALSSKKQNVLVVTYNITLISYLRDLALRAGVGNINDVTWINFHELCRHLCEDLGLMDRYRAIASGGKGNFFHAVPDMIREYLDASPSEAHQKLGLTQYDAILVDEGQDFTLEWWQLLRHLHKEGGEMLLVADTTQDLYDTARVWTEDEMPGSGFAGRWASLDVTYRLPPALAGLADDFSERFVTADRRLKSQLPQSELTIEPCALNWTQCRSVGAESKCVEAALQLITNAEDKNAAMTDLTILVGTKDFGREVMKQLNDKGIRTLTTFNPHDRKGIEAEYEERRRKLAFASNRPFVKISTIHSFKGWESRLLILHIDRAFEHTGPAHKERAGIYAAITRLKRDPRGSALSIICEEPTFEEYGRSWPRFLEA